MYGEYKDRKGQCNFTWYCFQEDDTKHCLYMGAILDHAWSGKVSLAENLRNYLKPRGLVQICLAGRLFQDKEGGGLGGHTGMEKCVFSINYKEIRSLP